ncbi:hypothetical protein [Phenylobacterium kunshanense]|uniref:Uncharacterized protein n=1 Tax=Phenylobacterium kunshanense TaxID=1445034 RepID=A0A328BHS7_9CAUL|nr:hypothetical protein [Phenylobacterium kunshanense]RAK65516.1 hypothetical protein DJ019_11175 [Phenylobacterium kunshanense]
MLRTVLFAAVLAVATPAVAQVEVVPLAAPDAFSTPGRDTGLPADLWAGTPVETARTVLPLLGARPLSPAAAVLARRLLATGARGPEGSAGDDTLAGQRASALLALGDVAAAARILDRAPGLERNAELSRAAAEAALLAGDAPRACRIAEGLATGRGEAYWLRLRAFCQAEAGQPAQAQLTFDLAQAQGRDVVYGRLMTAKLAGAAPGAASLRNGLDLALSRSLNLDLAAAKPSPAVAAALSGAEPPPPVFDTSAIDAQIGGLGASVLQGLPPEGALSALIAAAADADAKTRPRLQGAALLLAALANDLPGPDRLRVSAFAIPEGKAPAGRNLALEAAADARRAGEAALLALWTSAEAGVAGPALPDRVRIVRVLARAGFADEARLFVLEGLAGLK